MNFDKNEVSAAKELLEFIANWHKREAFKKDCRNVALLFKEIENQK